MSTGLFTKCQLLVDVLLTVRNLFLRKLTTTNDLNHDHDYTVNISFANDNDGDIQTLGKFSVVNPNGHL